MADRRAERLVVPLIVARPLGMARRFFVQHCKAKHVGHGDFFSVVISGLRRLSPSILNVELRKLGRYFSFMKSVDWSDLQVFAHVARGGGLSGAARAIGVSPATVGRRMLSLEKRIGRRLFTRRQTGYELTGDGRELLGKVLAMEASARPIATWLFEEAQAPVVRISAGTWTANFFSENFARLWSPDDGFRIAFKTTEARLDIAHREVDIGIRNKRPDGASFAGRRTAEVAFAPFQARGRAAAGRDDWVAIPPEDAATRTARWVNARHGGSIVAWGNTPRTLCDLIRSGVGKGVLPCFAGDRDPRLERAGEEIAELREDQWIVMHNDDRHRPEVRAVIDRIVGLIVPHRPLFAGRRPIG
jgi:DNA-binding transcriptional LysR family regulator